MTLRRDEVRRIAELARLELSQAEEELFADQLGQVIDHFTQLRRFDTASASEQSAPSHEADDAIVPSPDRDLFLVNAPRTRDGFLLVPRIAGVREEAD